MVLLYDVQSDLWHDWIQWKMISVNVFVPTLEFVS